MVDATFVLRANKYNKAKKKVWRRRSQIIAKFSQNTTHSDHNRPKPWPFGKFGPKMKLFIDNGGNIWERPDSLYFLKNMHFGHSQHLSEV